MNTSFNTIYIVISGLSGSGKTTITRQISFALGLPIISKDTIKEAIGDSYENEISVQVSMQIGKSSFATLFSIAKESNGAMLLEALWHPELSVPKLHDLPGALIEVHCHCNPAIAKQRFIDRSQTRHPVHTDNQRIKNMSVWTDKANKPLGIDPSVITVNTEKPVNIEDIINSITNHPVWVAREHS